MLATYLIIYDLRNPGRDYIALYEAIKSLSNDWQHPLTSTWFVSNVNVSSANDIFERLKPLIDNNDNLFIINMKNAVDRQGWMPKSFWQWIIGRLGN